MIFTLYSAPSPLHLLDESCREDPVMSESPARRLSFPPERFFPTAPLSVFHPLEPPGFALGDPASNASTVAFDPDDVAARRAAPSRARASIGVPNAADIAPDRTSRRSD